MFYILFQFILLFIIFFFLLETDSGKFSAQSEPFSTPHDKKERKVKRKKKLSLIKNPKEPFPHKTLTLKN